jgi:GNAT superfamily N-acetyltransferase
MGTFMKIRPVETTDRKIWEQMFNEYADFYKTSIPKGGHERVWGWIFDDNNDFWCDLVIEEDGVPFGFTQYQLMHRSLGGSMVCYLSDLYVRPEARGKSAGRALIDHVIEFAKSRGIANVRWLTQEFNYTGRRLYDTYGPKSDFILYSVPV